ncbi:trypsin-like peptidase domain-containing protein [Leptolyngbya sp. 7M]|uniref:trypsin-like peptidase domain-containing protein n=1 Tax=Leptolyngbya sp. 7M TaxID=2812896 RepID=UPI001B8C8F83|nr:trypsin-like peptidase domain-containing protein [Leptolyngbya sp. 7M]QYO62241.1 trypsin-like peptidase domain-containing protein [Leptolyngbya sp. 7M]
MTELPARLDTANSFYISETKRMFMNRRSIALGASMSALLWLPIQGLYISTSIAEASAQEVVSPQLSQEQLEQLAQSITVMVSTKDRYSSGSGVIIRKEGRVYTVLTNQHVLEPGAPYQVQTADGQAHTAELVTGVNFGENDLALLQFSSDANYTVASLANLSTITVGDAIFAAGFPSEAESGQSAGFVFRTGGQISFELEEQPLKGGYRIGYTSEIEKGMSGGPVLNRQGEVIGINGIYAHPLWGNPYVYADNSRPNDELRSRMRNSSWAVPVEMLAQLAPQYVSANLAQPTKADGSSSQSWPEIVRTVDQRAKEISVLIKWPTNSGSGVIVAREGNTYYVLTADHVASNAGLTVVTPDDQVHSVDSSLIKRWDGIDLAILQFTSPQNYQVATLADNPRALEDQVTFVSGWPERQSSATTNRQLHAGFLLGWGNDTNRARDERSLTRGYELLYTNFTERGISGGPVLDTEGRVIGIHAAAEADQGSQSPTVERADQASRYDLGYSLGIPIRTFLTKIRQDTIALNLNVEEALPQSLSAQAQDKIVASTINLEPPGSDANEIEWLSYGNKLWRLRRYEKSLDAYEQAIALKPDFFEAWYAHGMAEMGLKQYRNAIASFQKALEYGTSTADTDLADRQRSQAWRQISDAHYYSGAFEEALQAIQQAIDLTPNDFIIYQWKATILNDSGRHLEALKVSAEAIRKNPDSSVAYIKSAQTREYILDYSGAIVEVNKAIELQPDLAFAYSYRAYLSALQKNSARSPVSTSTEVQPNSATSGDKNQGGLGVGDRSGQVSVESSQAIYSKAQIIADLRKAESLQPYDASVYSVQGLVYAFLGDRQGCIEAFERALRLRPDSADIYAQKGYAFASLGEPEAAINRK